MENLITYEQVYLRVGITRQTLRKRIVEKKIKSYVYLSDNRRPQKAITLQDYEVIKAMGRKEYSMEKKDPPVQTNDRFSTSSKCGASAENREHSFYMRISPYWSLNCQQKEVV